MDERWPHIHTSTGRQKLSAYSPSYGCRYCSGFWPRCCWSFFPSIINFIYLCLLIMSVNKTFLHNCCMLPLQEKAKFLTIGIGVCYYYLNLEFTINITYILQINAKLLIIYSEIAGTMHYCVHGKEVTILFLTSIKLNLLVRVFLFRKVIVKHISIFFYITIISIYYYVTCINIFLSCNLPSFCFIIVCLYYSHLLVIKYPSATAATHNCRHVLIIEFTFYTTCYKHITLKNDT